MKVATVFALLVALTGALAAAQESAALEPLNTGVNAMLQAAGAPNRAAARVVPIVSSGGGINGYAQIIGPQGAVRATKAVLMLQTVAGGAGTITALIPVTSVTRTNGAVHRADGVAVDAVIGAHF
jgi:hypothetical protein